MTKLSVKKKKNETFCLSEKVTNLDLVLIEKTVVYEISLDDVHDSILLVHQNLIMHYYNYQLMQNFDIDYYYAYLHKISELFQNFEYYSVMMISISNKKENKYSKMESYFILEEDDLLQFHSHSHYYFVV
jgi:nitrogen-specific signal transduction histidine kinase